MSYSAGHKAASHSSPLSLLMICSRPLPQDPLYQ